MSKHKLLLADDSITIQKVVNLTFADEGVEVVSVGDGNTAMEKFAEITPDLVMADINMPGLNGYEICERIKQSEATRKIPVILLVGSYEPFDEQEARRVGADDFLTKPFQSIRQLVTKVSGLLESSSASADAATDAIISDLETPPAEKLPGEFEDTLRMRNEQAEREELGDTGMDDEMIQTSQVSRYEVEEMPEFQSQAESESQDVGKTQPLTPDELNEINSFQTTETEAVQETTDAAEEERGYAFVGETPQTENQSFEQSVYSYQPQEQETEALSDETPASPELEDDANLLELPPQENLSAAAFSQPVWQEEDIVPVGETTENAQQITAFQTPETSRSEPESAFQPEVEEIGTIEPAREAETPARFEEVQFRLTDEMPQTERAESVGEPVADEAQSEEQAETPFETSETVSAETTETSQVEPSEELETQAEETAPEVAPSQIGELPPQVIEAIAAKVSERFSDQIIREIVAQVTPQITELIARRIAEENPRE